MRERGVLALIVALTLVNVVAPLPIVANPARQVSPYAGRFVQAPDRSFVYILGATRYPVAVLPIAASDLSVVPTGFPIYSRSDVCELTPSGDATMIQQLRPFHGRFVNPHDDSLWFVFGGFRFQAQTLEIADEELSQFELGPEIGSREELCRLAEVDQAIAANPVVALVGAQIRACREGSPFVVTVDEAANTRELNGRRANGQWITMVVTAVNTSAKNETLFQAVRLRDDQGRDWGDIAGTTTAAEIGYLNLANDKQAAVANRLIRPNTPTRVLLIFDIARDIRSLEVFAANTLC